MEEYTQLLSAVEVRGFARVATMRMTY